MHPSLEDSVFKLGALPIPVIGFVACVAAPFSLTDPFLFKHETASKRKSDEKNSLELKFMVRTVYG